MFEYRQANLLIEPLMQRKNCAVHAEALESHYLKVIMKPPKGQLWTCYSKKIMQAIMFHTITGKRKKKKKSGTCSEYNSH